MRNWADDIDKYHKGMLSAAEMNRLEREALNDPFLADALEGAALAPQEFAKDVQQLNSRIQKKNNRPAGLWRLAASIVLLAGLGASIWFLRSGEGPAVVAEGEKTTAAPLDSGPEKNLETASAQPPSSGKEDEQPSAGQKNNAPSPRKKATPPAQESRDLALTTARQGAAADTLAGVAAVAEATPAAAEIGALPPAPAKESERLLRDEAQPQFESRLVPSQQRVAGRVTDDEGNALPGVNVLVKGTTVGTVTDVDGRYEIPVPGSQTELVFSFIGFNTQQVAVGDRKELNTALASDVAQLSEVVVTGYGITPGADREPVIKLAEPEGGRRAYNKYLDSQVRYPEQAKAQNVKGRVTLQFTVRTDGSLDEFNVLKGLGYGCDEEVIRLVKEGPRWQPTTEDEVPVESAVRIRVKFAPPGR